MEPYVVIHAGGPVPNEKEIVQRFRRKMLWHKYSNPDCPHCEGIDWLLVDIVLDESESDFPIPTWNVVEEEQ